MLQSVFPFSNGTYCGTDILVQGIKLGTVRDPLHNVYYLGFAKVAVQLQLPVSGGMFILGNDIGLGRWFPLPKLRPNWKSVPMT